MLPLGQDLGQQMGREPQRPAHLSATISDDPGNQGASLRCAQCGTASPELRMVREKNCPQAWLSRLGEARASHAVFLLSGEDSWVRPGCHLEG